MSNLPPDPGFIGIPEQVLVEDAGRIAKVVGLDPTQVELVTHLTVHYGPQFYGIIRQLFLYTGKTQATRALGYAASAAAGFAVAWFIFH